MGNSKHRCLDHRCPKAPGKSWCPSPSHTEEGTMCAPAWPRCFFSSDLAPDTARCLGFTHLVCLACLLFTVDRSWVLPTFSSPLVTLGSPLLGTGFREGGEWVLGEGKAQWASILGVNLQGQTNNAQGPPDQLLQSAWVSGLRAPGDPASGQSASTPRPPQS